MGSRPPLIKVTLRLTGLGFSPDDLTAIIQLTPTATWRVGDSISKTKLKRKHDGWTFGLPQRETFDMEGYLRELLDALEPSVKGIIAVTDSFKLDAEISFGVLIYEAEPAGWFSSDTIRRVAALNAGLDIDLIHVEP